MKYTVDLLEKDQECAVMLSMALMLSVDGGAQFWKDGKETDPDNLELVVMPLQRLGAPAGESGAEVFVVHLRSLQPKQHQNPSEALVVKMDKGRGKLKAEMEAGAMWPPIASGERFARPLRLFSLRGYEVLLAPFQAAVKPDLDEHRLRFQKVQDIWQLLRNVEGSGKAFGYIDERIASALTLVAEAHKANRKTVVLSYSTIYKRYLRKTEPGGTYANEIGNLFGNSAVDDVVLFGQTWRNPRRVLERVLTEHDQFRGVIGAVHGDLHPKNVVLDDKEQVRIIDFGWARNDMHVVVDYLLLDWNLRAITLAPYFHEAELCAAARHLAPDDDKTFVEGLSPILREHMNCVRNTIWRSAIADGAVSGSTGKAWLHEYVIPYLIVGYGLLRYARTAANERALLLSVLAASERIHNELFSEGME